MFTKTEVDSLDGVVVLYDHLCFTLARDGKDVAEVLKARLTHNIVT